MTKITKDTELKAGMKVMINEEILTIIEYGVTKSLGFIDSNHITTLCIRYTSGTKEQKLNELRDVLIENNAKLIDDNAKVFVSEYIARKLEKAKRDSIAMENGKLKAHTFAWKLLGSLSTVDVREEELSLQKIVKICEDTTIFKNGWEVEKLKRWRASCCEKYWIVDSTGQAFRCREENHYVDNDRYGLGNYFQTKEQAEAKAKRIRDILKGGE